MGRPRCHPDFTGTDLDFSRQGRQSQETGGVSILIRTHTAYSLGQPSTPAREGEEDKMRLRLLPGIVTGVLFGTFLAIPSIAPAQSTATINGTLTDPSGAAVVGAQIKALSLDSSGK